YLSTHSWVRSLSTLSVNFVIIKIFNSHHWYIVLYINISPSNGETEYGSSNTYPDGRYHSRSGRNGPCNRSIIRRFHHHRCGRLTRPRCGHRHENEKQRSIHHAPPRNYPFPALYILHMAGSAHSPVCAAFRSPGIEHVSVDTVCGLPACFCRYIQFLRHAGAAADK